MTTLVGVDGVGKNRADLADAAANRRPERRATAPKQCARCPLDLTIASP